MKIWWLVLPAGIESNFGAVSASFSGLLRNLKKIYEYQNLLLFSRGGYVYLLIRSAKCIFKKYIFEKWNFFETKYEDETFLKTFLGFQNEAKRKIKNVLKTCLRNTNKNVSKNTINMF